MASTPGWDPERTATDGTAGRIEALRAALTPLADAERAESMARYLQNHFQFLGIPTPQRRAAQKPVLAGLVSADGDELIAFARACWAVNAREFQHSATDALRKHHGVLNARHLDDLAHLITHKSWWDTVDSLAPTRWGGWFLATGTWR